MNKSAWFDRLVFMAFFSTIASVGCNKTDRPLGVDAPFGLDRPTYTPTPSSGAIQVYVSDAGTAIQGVSIIVVDPAGNTLGPNLTQPVVGYAAFNPTNLLNGTWVAKVLTQGVSYNLPTPVNHYYYLSSQLFTVTGAGSYSVTFSTITSGNIVSVAPASVSFGTAFPVNMSVTVTYSPIGNLNVPVSVVCPILPFGINTAPSTFVLGEGVTQQPVTISKINCFSKKIPFQVSTFDFTGFALAPNPVTIYHGYPVTIQMWGDNSFNFGIYTSNDCGVVWNWSIDSTHGFGNLGSGSIQSGGSTGSLTDDSGDNVNFTISNTSVGTFSGNINLFSLGAGPTTFYNVISGQ